MAAREARADTAELLGLYPPAPALNPLPPALLNAPDHVGVLTKQGAEVKSWKSRHFLLCGTQLFYFATPPGPAVTPKGVIHVLGSRSELDSTSGRSHTIALWARVGFTGKRQYQGRTYLLQAIDGPSLSAWLVALQRAARASLIPLASVSTSWGSAPGISTSPAPAPAPSSPRLSVAPVSPRPTSSAPGTTAASRASANTASPARASESSNPSNNPNNPSPTSVSPNNRASASPSQRHSSAGSPRRSFLASTRHQLPEMEHCAIVLVTQEAHLSDAFESGAWLLLRHLLASPLPSLAPSIVIYAPSLPVIHPYHAYASRFMPLASLLTPSTSAPSARLAAALLIADDSPEMDDASLPTTSQVLLSLGNRGLKRVSCVLSSPSLLPAASAAAGVAEGVPITVGPFACALLSRAFSAADWVLPSVDVAPVEEAALAKRIWTLVGSPEPVHLHGPALMSPDTAHASAKGVLGQRVQLRIAAGKVLGAWNPPASTQASHENVGASFDALCRNRAKRVAIIADGAHAQLSVLLAHALSLRGYACRLLAPGAAHSRFRDVLPLDAELGVCDGVEELRPASVNGASQLVVLYDWSATTASSRPLAAALAAAGVACVFLGAAPVRTTSAALARPYTEAESVLEVASVPYRVVHLSPLMQTLGRSAAASVKEENRVYSAWGTGRVSYIDARDAAAAMASLCVLLVSGAAPPQKRFTLTGPEAVEHTAVAAALTALLNRAVLYQPLEEVAHEAALRATRPESEVMSQITLARAYASDAGAQVTSDAVQLHGWTPRTFAMWLKDNSSIFT